MSKSFSPPTRRRYRIGALSAGALLLAAALWSAFSVSFPSRVYAGKGGGGGGGTTATYTTVELGMSANHINDLGVIVGDISLATVIDPLDVDGDGTPDTWFLDADGDGYNDLVELLPPLYTNPADPPWSKALASNESGETVGWSNQPGKPTGEDRNNTAVLWRNGTVTNLSALLAGHLSRATDINASGQVVGWTAPDTTGLINSQTNYQYVLIDPLDTDGDGAPDTWFVDDGFGGNALMLDISVVPPAAVTATTDRFGPLINDSGWICLNQAVSGTMQPFVIIPQDADGDGAPDTWFRDADGDGVNDLAHELKKPGGKYAWAYGLNSSGVIVGKTGSDATVWTVTADGGSQATSLGVPKGPHPHNSAAAYVVNDAGQIAGHVFYYPNNNQLGSENVCVWQDVNDNGTLLFGFDAIITSLGSASMNNFGEFVEAGELLLPNAP